MWPMLSNNVPLLTVIVILLGALLLGRLLLPDRRLPYEKRPSLVTEAEHLLDVSQPRYQVFTMVRLADVIRVRAETSKPLAWQNRILAKHLDFVLCDPQTLEAKLAVELDDATHQRPDRRERDEFLESALSASHLPLLRVPVADKYDRETLKKAIEQLVA
jgi:very-short-patch-repair endonuclease